MGTRFVLKHCSSCRSVSGSLPDGVIGIFHLPTSSGRTTALGSTQPPTEMRNGKISCAIKAAGVWSVLVPKHVASS